jgi:hypothetical protein
LRYADSIEDIRFEKAKPEIVAILQRYIKKKYTVNIAVDSISLESFVYDSDLEGWIDKISDRQYFAWVKTSRTAEKYSFALRNDSVIGFKEITLKSKNDSRLEKIRNDFKKEEAARVASQRKDDSIADLLRARADSIFKKNEKTIKAKAQAYLASKVKSIKIDSISFSDFTWSDSSSVPRITEYEYTVWAILNSEFVGMYRLLYRGGVFVDFYGEKIA